MIHRIVEHYEMGYLEVVETFERGYLLKINSRCTVELWEGDLVGRRLFTMHKTWLDRNYLINKMAKDVLHRKYADEVPQNIN